MLKWWRRWKRRQQCFHHSQKMYDTQSQQWAPVESWIQSQLIDAGRAKMFWCTGCEKTWIV